MLIYLISFLLVFYSSGFGMEKDESNRLPQLELQRPSTNKRIACSDVFKAAYDCNLDQLKTVVSKVNVNKTNKVGKSIIFSVIRKSFDDANAPIETVLDFLIEKGALLDSYGDGFRLTPLKYATILSIKNEKPNFRALKHLLARKANAFATPFKTRSCLDYALTCARIGKKAQYPNAVKVLDILRDSASTLHEAILAFNVAKVQEFATPETVKELNDEKKTPLFMAIARFNEYTKSATTLFLHHLFRAGSDANEGVKYMSLPGNTNLIAATIVSIIQSDCTMIPILLHYHGNPNHSTKDGIYPTAYDIAYTASYLSEEDVKKMSSIGYNLENIKKNKDVALQILDIFNLNQNYKEKKSNTPNSQTNKLFGI